MSHCETLGSDVLPAIDVHAYTRAIVSLKLHDSPPAALERARWHFAKLQRGEAWPWRKFNWQLQSKVSPLLSRPLPLCRCLVRRRFSTTCSLPSASRTGRRPEQEGERGRRGRPDTPGPVPAHAMSSTALSFVGPRPGFASVRLLLPPVSSESSPFVPILASSPVTAGRPHAAHEEMARRQT